jgi:transmembrane sensor
VKPAADEGEPLRGEAVDWLMRLQAAPGDAAVRAAFDAWLETSEAHRRAWQSVSRVWRLSEGLPATDAPASANVMALPRARRIRRAFVIAATALAACIALYFAPVLQLRLQADHMTSVAELGDVALEDGSVVQLDAGSAIAVRYGSARREVVLLAGRAYFDVVQAKDRPFVVVADDVTVTVTGTAFDVRSAGDGVSVAVQSGTVEVGLDGGARLAGTLTRGQRLSVSRGTRQVVKSEMAPEDVASWRERRLVVDGVALAEVVEELGRHYHGFIVLRDRSLAERRITGVFDLRRPVEALNAVARTQHGSVTEITPFMLVVSPGPAPGKSPSAP